MSAAAAARVSYAHCYCGQTEAYDRTVGLPAGWRPSADGSRIECPDCARSARAGADILRSGAQASIPADAATKGQLGYRVAHSIFGDAVVLRIHAGAKPVPGGRDEPVHFLLRAADLDDVIAHLRTIRTELNRENING